MTETATVPVLINYAEALRRLEAVADGRKDYVNAVRLADGTLSDCTNLKRAEDGSIVGSCIVGSAFAAELIEAGVTPEMRVNSGGVYAMLTDGLPGRVEVTAKAYQFLEAAQSAQDGGTAWGDAIEYAKGRVEDDYDDADDTVAADPDTV